MKRVSPWLLPLLLIALGGMVVVACTDDGEGAAQTVSQQSKDAWAKMRTDSDRLVDNVQKNKDQASKQTLLDNCRNTQEQMAKNDAERARRVERVCDQIRDADPANSNAWSDIKKRLDELNKEIGQ